MLRMTSGWVYVETAQSASRTFTSAATCAIGAPRSNSGWVTSRQDDRPPHAVSRRSEGTVRQACRRARITTHLGVQPLNMGKRDYGTGHVYVKHGSYYGRWRTLDGRLVNRKLGKVRPVGQRSGGLTRVQAGREMARRREQENNVETLHQTLEDLLGTNEAMFAESRTRRRGPRRHFGGQAGGRSSSPSSGEVEFLGTRRPHGGCKRRWVVHTVVCPACKADAAVRGDVAVRGATRLDPDR